MKHTIKSFCFIITLLFAWQHTYSQVDQAQIDALKKMAEKMKGMNTSEILKYTDSIQQAAKSIRYNTGKKILNEQSPNTPKANDDVMDVLINRKFDTAFTIVDFSFKTTKKYRDYSEVCTANGSTDKAVVYKSSTSQTIFVQSPSKAIREILEGQVRTKAITQKYADNYMSLKGDVLYKKDFDFDGHIVHEIGTEISDEKPLAFTFNFDVTQNFSAIGIDAGVNVNGKERLAIGAEETTYKAIRGSGIGANTDMRQVKMAGLTNPQNDDPDKPFCKVAKTATGFVVTYSYTKIEGSGNDKTTITEELTAYIGQYHEEADAVIKPLSSNEVAYEKWIPKGEEPPTKNGSQITENKGNKISFGVSLINKITKAKIADNDAVVIYELPENEITKNEGSCINYPFAGADNEPDLEFDESFYKNNALVESYSKTKIVSTLKNGLTLPAVVKSKDFAAYGKLKATVVYKGNSYQAHNDKNLTSITIPLDDNNNKIADAWEKAKDIFTKNYDMYWDNEHVDNNDYDGDGLTLYEEYRGIIAKDKHIRLNPSQKDLIIANDVGDVLSSGIKLLENSAQIKIIEINKEELSSKEHIINSNMSISKKGDQHAILCVKHIFEKSTDAYDTAEGATDGSVMGFAVPKTKNALGSIFGSPKDCIEYRINQNRLNQPYNVRINFGHEIGHACGLSHHAAEAPITLGLYKKRYLSDKASFIDSVIIINATGKIIYAKKRKEKLDPKIFDNSFTVDKLQNTNATSGDVRCLMTYNMSLYYAYQTSNEQVSFKNADAVLEYYSIVRFYITPFGENEIFNTKNDISQNKFCTSGEGTEWNSGGKLFGNADNYNCFGKFRIKDY